MESEDYVALEADLEMRADQELDIELEGEGPEDVVLSFAMEEEPEFGVIEGDAPDVRYVPDAGFDGADSFTFRVFDETYTSAPGEVRITVLPANQPPLAFDVTASGPQRTEISFTLDATDPEGDELTYAIVGAPENGAVTLDGAEGIYVPDDEFSGEESFTWRAFDGMAYSNEAMVTVTVEYVNRPPVASDSVVSTPRFTAIRVPLQAVDPDGDAMTYELVAQPSHGEAILDEDEVTYTPDGDFVGTDSFIWRAYDGEAFSNVGTVTITVEDAPQVPTADDLEITTDRFEAVEVVFSGNDLDDRPLTFEVIDGPEHGTLSGTGDTRTYTPDGDYYGADAFTYRASNGSLQSEPATVAITVNFVASAPTVADRTLEAVGNSLRSVDAAEGLLEGAVAGDGDLVAVAGSLSTSEGGTVDIASDGSFVYQPPANFEGADFFDFEVENSFGLQDSARVTIDVEGLPRFADSSASSGGTGTQWDPFHTLADALAAAGTSDDAVALGGSVFEESVILDAGALLRGEADASSPPRIEPASGPGVVMASGSRLVGVEVRSVDSDCVVAQANAEEALVLRDVHLSSCGLHGLRALADGGGERVIDVRDLQVQDAVNGVEIVAQPGTTATLLIHESEVQVQVTPLNLYAAPSASEGDNRVTASGDGVVLERAGSGEHIREAHFGNGPAGSVTIEGLLLLP